MKYIDLSYPLAAHWRWKFHKTIERDYTMGGPLREEILYMPVHCFTHMDPPAHADPEGAFINEIPLETLIGPAAVLDFSDFPDDTEITAEALEARGSHFSGGMVLIKTCRNLKYTLNEADFWMKSPYMGESAGKWLIEKKATVVGFDFPQDYVLRDFFSGKVPTIEQMTMHELLLKNGIVQLEYLTNLDQLTNPEVQLYAIPLRLAHTAGSPARVFAAYDSRTDA